MLKLNASYSKKIPVSGEEFSSQAYYAAIEVELPDGLSPDQIKDKIHGTCEAGRNAGEAERHGCATSHNPTAPTPPAKRTQQKASPKQLKYIIDLAARRHMTPGDVNAAVQRRFGVADVNQLSRAQASALIDEITAEAA
jgi:hypothetical protein